MNTTINEEIAHDCVQELLKKLSDERKLSSTQNARIAELEAKNYKLRLFNKEFELWLEAERKEYKDILCERFDNDSWVAQDVLGDVIEKRNETPVPTPGRKGE